MHQVITKHASSKSEYVWYREMFFVCFFMLFCFSCENQGDINGEMCVNWKMTEMATTHCITAEIFHVDCLAKEALC